MRAVFATLFALAGAQAPEEWKVCGSSPVCCDPNEGSQHTFCPGQVPCGYCGTQSCGLKEHCACPGYYAAEGASQATLYWSAAAPQSAAPAQSAPSVASQPTTQDAPKVVVLFLTEAGCPPCQRAVTGPMNALVTAAGVADIMDLQQHPFGNNYFATSECGGEPYDTNVRHCWAKTCVESSTPPADCFTGDLVTQHGAAEGMVNRMEACAKAHSPTWQAYWPFLLCMEREYATQAAAAFQQCIGEAKLDSATLESCYMSGEGDRLMVQEAKATIDHEGTPTIKVNGKEVQADQVLREVCAAYTGTKPQGCLGPLQV